VQSNDEDGREWMDTIADDGPIAEETVAQNADLTRVRVWLAEAFEALSMRERQIIQARKLDDETRTLESLGQELGISKERVRQLEVQALTKLRKSLEKQAGPLARNFLND